MPAIVSGNENGYEKFYHPNVHKTKHPENIDLARSQDEEGAERRQGFDSISIWINKKGELTRSPSMYAVRRE